MTPIPFDSPIWHQVPTAYGTADELPKLLQRCVESEDAALWGDLYNEVCHQGTPYGSAWALIPHLVERLDALDVDGLYTALGIIAANVRSAPEAPPLDVLNPPYRAAIARLRERLVPHVRSRASVLEERWAEGDPESGEYERALLASDICGCLGKIAAAEVIGSIEAGREVYVLCPDCDELLRLFLMNDGPELASVDGTKWPSGPPSAASLLPDIQTALRRGEHLLGVAASEWNDHDAVLALAAFVALDLRDRQLATAMLGAAASAPCPGCGRSLDVLAHLGEEP